ncbi:interferon a3-like [Amia ocellicauda]|uniref:interferon a3-like n=1 Tax=Amia ocellicauda TaxID=2972642 RepID=UPI00346417AC
MLPLYLKKKNLMDFEWHFIKAGNFPDECYEDNMKLMFPAEAYILPKESQHQDFVLLAHEALSYIFSIIQNNLKSVPWDRDDVDHFQGLIFRQMEELEKCMDVKITSSGDSSSPTKGKMLLKTYFETLEKLLKDKGYNICAWEIIRKEVLHNLQDFHKFLKRQKN